MEFPKVYEKCPICGCKDTVSEEACASDPSLSKAANQSMEKKITPIQDFTKISTPTTKILIRSYDTCSNCGTDYCIRIEKSSMPTDALMKMMGMTTLPIGRK